MIEPRGMGTEKEELRSAHAYRLRDRRRYRSCCTQRHRMASRNVPAAQPKCVFRRIRLWGARDVHCGLGIRISPGRLISNSLLSRRAWATISGQTRTHKPSNTRPATTNVAAIIATNVHIWGPTAGLVSSVGSFSGPSMNYAFARSPTSRVDPLY